MSKQIWDLCYNKTQKPQAWQVHFTGRIVKIHDVGKILVLQYSLMI